MTTNSKNLNLFSQAEDWVLFEWISYMDCLNQIDNSTLEPEIVGQRMLG